MTLPPFVAIKIKERIMKVSILKGKTKAELQTIAQQLEVSDFSNLTKTALIEKITTINNGSAAPVQTVSPLEYQTGSSSGSQYNNDQEAVEDSKYYEGFVRQSFQEQSWSLPKGYGDTKVVLLIRDPHWLYSYWEINAQAVAEMQHKIGNDFSYSEINIRAYDITDIEFDGSNAHSYFDVAVGSADRWYINIPESNRSYVVDIGYKTPDGRFFIVCRSNVITAPRHSHSNNYDEEWMAVEGRTYFDKMYALSGGYNKGATSGELFGEKKELIAKKLEGLLNLTSGELFPTVSSLNVSSPVGGGHQSFGGQRNKDFWLVANTELIVYGATEPDASLTVCGRPVKLSKDGTFRLRFALPDGQQDIPIVAVNKDGDDSRQIEFQVNRKQK